MSRAALIRAAAGLLILLSVALSASTWHVYGHTWDEPEHLAAGVELLDRGRYEYDTEHPPLARLFIALGPWLAGAHSFATPPPSGVQEGVDILYDGGHYERTLTLARMGALPFLPLLLFACWLWARRVAMNDAEALLALALLASVPAVIGHAALAALDVPGAATTLLALYWLQRWFVGGAVRDAVWAGLAVGIAISTKFSALPFLALGAVVMVAVRAAQTTPGAAPGQRWPARFGAALLLCVLPWIPVFISYGSRSFVWQPLPRRFDWVFPYLFHEAAVREQARALVSSWRLPAAVWELAEGILALAAHNDTGHLSYLFGELRAGGWWYFYLVDLAVKTPLPLLLAGVPGLALLARQGWQQRCAWALSPAALFVTLLGFASLVSRINIGVRHVLILYPLLALGAAHGLMWLWRQGRLLPRAVMSGLVLWQLSTWWSAWPDYFPWFNGLARDPQALLTDSDLDWGGQDLRRLEARLAALHVTTLNFAYQGTADLAREPLPRIVPLPPGQQVAGWVAITALARAHGRHGYDWLRRYRPERIGTSIDLYDIAATAPGPAPAR